MEGGSVWFRASIGRRKNAEARWLLPMICRRGGIDKNDIGAIKIYESITEFEISAKAAEKFAAKVQDPDKDEHIRIEALPDGPQGQAPSEKSGDEPARDAKTFDAKTFDAKPRPHGKPRYDKGPKHQGGPAGGTKFDKKPGFDKKRRHDHKPAHAGQPRPDNAAPFAKSAFGKPAFGKKPKKNKYRG
jgi:ATP-dependent RNA helicase DeaD